MLLRKKIPRNDPIPSKVCHTHTIALAHVPHMNMNTLTHTLTFGCYTGPVSEMKLVHTINWCDLNPPIVVGAIPETRFQMASLWPPELIARLAFRARLAFHWNRVEDMFASARLPRYGRDDVSFSCCWPKGTIFPIPLVFTHFQRIRRKFGCSLEACAPGVNSTHRRWNWHRFYSGFAYS